jgi:hypothetical protein
MIVSTIASNLMFGKKKPKMRRESAVPFSVRRDSFVLPEDTATVIEPVLETPFTDIVVKIRLGKQLNENDITFINNLGRDSILELLLEFNAVMN